MLATPIRRLRATTSLPQKLFNKEYTRLTGDSAVVPALLSITLSYFRVVVCDLVIRAFIHYTLNTNLGRPNPCPQLGDHDR